MFANLPSAAIVRNIIASGNGPHSLVSTPEIKRIQSLDGEVSPLKETQSKRRLSYRFNDTRRLVRRAKTSAHVRTTRTAGRELEPDLNSLRLSSSRGGEKASAILYSDSSLPSRTNTLIFLPRFCPSITSVNTHTLYLASLCYETFCREGCSRSLPCVEENIRPHTRVPPTRELALLASLFTSGLIRSQSANFIRGCSEFTLQG